MRSIAPARLTMAPLKRQSVFSREKRPVRATYGNALMQQVVGGADSRADGRFGIVVVVVVSFGGTAEGLPSPPPFGSVLTVCVVRAHLLTFLCPVFFRVSVFFFRPLTLLSAGSFLIT